ncbi:hypothetical protein GCM10010497_41110 [Streptomyces cinereoruber]|uniref:Uncharacterized protein n=1 Tax=Streptomyces cinereoruber TaxID=67260 RepID=A0AAV4KLN8_9ACTN|nr:hypothetical protein GCM10010497_41110 [Streptomyces cinereoruber]
MEGDDGLEAGRAVLAEHDLLVATLFRAEEGVQHVCGIDRNAGHIGHGGDSQVRSGGFDPPCGWGRDQFGKRVSATWA